MKKKFFPFLILVGGFLLLSSSSFARGGSGVAQQYTDYSLDRPWVAIGGSYSLFAQTNKTFPNINVANRNKTLGNAFDVFAEVFATRFLSLYFAYQYMTYDWRGRPKNENVVSHKALQGAKLYFGGLFVSGGAYESWISRKLQGQSEAKGSGWGPFVGFGYSYSILQDVFNIETGARFYFIPNTGKNRRNLSLDYTANGSRDAKYWSWDWYIGLKVLI